MDCFAIHQKLTLHRKSAILQLYIYSSMKYLELPYDLIILDCLITINWFTVL